MGKTWYVYEGVGVNDAGGGTEENPCATLAYVLAHGHGEDGDTIMFKTKYIARNLPNPGSPDYRRCYFVDAASGTDGANHGHWNGSYAWRTLQYALDNTSSAVTAWIFCKGTETLSAAIDADVGTIQGHWQIVEGYTNSPRDGGYYVIDGGGSVATGIQWGNADGILLANVKLQNFTGTVVHFGNPGSDSGMVCWNVWALAASGQSAFYSQNGANVTILLYCRASNGASGFNLAYGSGLCVGCYALNCSTAGFNAQQRLVAQRCIAKGCGIGFAQWNGRLVCLNCLAYACTGAGFIAQTQYGILVAEGCIAKSCGGYGFDRFDGSKITWMLLTNCAAHGNTSGAWRTYEQFNGLLTGDPLLVDAANEDFRVRAGSPCLNGGVSNLHSMITSGQFAHIGPHVHRLVPPAASRLARPGNPGAAMSL